jgi:hypothetical protein
MTTRKAPTARSGQTSDPVEAKLAPELPVPVLPVDPAAVVAAAATVVDVVVVVEVLVGSFGEDAAVAAASLSS